MNPNPDEKIENILEHPEYLAIIAEEEERALTRVAELLLVVEAERVAIWEERLHMTRSFYQLNRKLQIFLRLLDYNFILEKRDIIILSLTSLAPYLIL